MEKPRNQSLFNTAALPLAASLPLQDSDLDTYDRYTAALEAGDPATVAFKETVEVAGYTVRLGGSPRGRTIQPLVLERLQEAIGEAWPLALELALDVQNGIEHDIKESPHLTTEYIAGLAILIHRQVSHPDFMQLRLQRAIRKHSPAWYGIQAKEQFPGLRREIGVFRVMLRRYNVTGDTWPIDGSRGPQIPRWRPEAPAEPFDWKAAGYGDPDAYDVYRDMGIPNPRHPKADDDPAVTGSVERLEGGQGGSITVEVEPHRMYEFPPSHMVTSSEDAEWLSGAPEPGNVNSFGWSTELPYELASDPDPEPLECMPSNDYLEDLVQRLTDYAQALERAISHSGCHVGYLDQLRAEHGIRTTTRTFYEITNEDI